MTHSERQKRIIQTTQVTPMLQGCEEETREEGDLRKILEQELAEQRTQLEEMEDKLQQTEDQKMRLEVNRQAWKTQFERDLAAKEEAREEKRRGMAKQLRDVKTELNEERKPKQAAVNDKKKLETEYKDLESTRDINNKLKEDVLKQTEDQKRRLEVNMQARKTQFERDLAAKEEERK